MLINYLKTAVRSFKQQKQHFILNVLSFSIGIAAAILIALFSYNELQIDRQQPDAERVYRVYSDSTAMGLSKDGAINPLVPLAMQNHSQIESLMLLGNSYFLQNGEYILSDLVNVDAQQFKLKRFYVASANIKDFVNIEVIKGDLTKVLQQPDLLALSVSEATRVFGHTDIIGKTLTHQSGLYTVGAVFNDMAENTHFGFDVLTYLPKLNRGPFGSHVYLKLQKGTDIETLAQEMTDELHRRSPSRKLQKFDLIALKDVHFNSDGETEMKQGGSYLALQVSIGLAAMLVLIASVNFINFNITGAARRAKEIGVRKALGATKAQLISQFLLESLLLVIFAGTIAMQLVELALPAFNQLMDRQLTLEYQSPFMLLVMLAIVAIGLLSGLYPALFMSSFSAKRVLSGDLNRGSIAIWLRKFTLCAQCAVSISLLIVTFTLYAQISLIQELEIGYAKQDRLVVKGLPSDLLYQKDGSALLDGLNRIDGVEKVTLSDTNYANSMMMTLSFIWPNGEKLTGMQPNIVTGFNAVETLGLTLLAGRDFSPQFSGDWYEEDNQGNRTAGLLVSKRMVELAGYNNLDDVTGLTLTIPRRNLSVKVVGVVEDIRLGSVTKPILPSSFILGFIRNGQANIVLKVDSAHKQAVANQVQSILIEQLSRADVSMNWIGDDVRASHKNESITLTMVSLFSPLAIILTCLGTFGLASFATLRRQKEVAVRKVLGATRLSIVNIIAKEFLLLVIISIVIAYPLSYWLLDDWLSNFNERIEQGLWVYLIAGHSIALITWLTVASLAFKAASSRPSLILRYE